MDTIIRTLEASRKDFVECYYKGFEKFFGSTTIALLNYYDEDSYSGYPNEPGGSVWESEGKSLYCLIRLLKPKSILEIGNFKGVSTNHILAAVQRNDPAWVGHIHGEHPREFMKRMLALTEVVLVDIAEQIDYDKLHVKNIRFRRHLIDSIAYLGYEDPLEHDLYVIDGDHSTKHTSMELEMILRRAKRPFYIWAHDYHVTHDKSCGVQETWDRFANHFDLCIPFKDYVSNCGFIIAKKS